MRKVPWSIRAARRSDRERLRRFQCARDGSTAQLEVEEFIQADLLDWAFEPRAREGDPRLLLLLDGTSLVGVAAHERKTLQAPNWDIFAASKLEVVALARSWQGRSFPNGVRASDVLMSAVMQDIATRVPPRCARVFAFVHQDNRASLALLRRYGLVDEMDRLDETSPYRRLITGHRRERARPRSNR